jgi:hypothetical protein
MTERDSSSVVCAAVSRSPQHTCYRFRDGRSSINLAIQRRKQYCHIYKINRQAYSKEVAHKHSGHAQQKRGGMEETSSNGHKLKGTKMNRGHHDDLQDMYILQSRISTSREYAPRAKNPHDLTENCFPTKQISRDERSKHRESPV